MKQLAVSTQHSARESVWCLTDILASQVTEHEIVPWTNDVR